MKPFCSAKQGIAAVEAFRAILASPVRPNAIAKVRVRVPRAYAGMIATPAEPGARQSTLVSVAHQIALAALQPERLYDVDRSVAKPDKDIAQFAAKVEVIADAELDAFYPRHWPAEVEVEAGAKVFRRRMVEASGDPERPLDRAGIEEKARSVLDPLLGSAATAKWLALCHGALASSAGCKRLASALTGANGE